SFLTATHFPLQTLILLFSFSCRRWYTCTVPSRGSAHVAEVAAREQPEPAEPHRRAADAGAGGSLPGRRRSGVRRRPGDRSRAGAPGKEAGGGRGRVGEASRDTEQARCLTAPLRHSTGERRNGSNHSMPSSEGRGSARALQALSTGAVATGA